MSGACGPFSGEAASRLPRSFVVRNASRAGRFTPLHPRLAAAGFRAALPIAERFFRNKHIYRSNSHFAAERSQELVARLARGETAYLAGISIGGFHNTGAALVEVTAAGGPRIICNNEEERFSGRKHASTYPSASLEALTKIMKDLGIGPEQIVAWLATYDYPLFVATSFRSVLEEFPASLGLVFQDHRPTFDRTNSRKEFAPPPDLAGSSASTTPCQSSGCRTTTITHGSHIWSRRSPEINSR